MTARPACFHCGAPLGGAPLELAIDGRTVQLCSAACRDVAQRIRDDGLTGFYRFRDAPTGPPPDGATAGPDRWAAFDRPALQAGFVRALADGTREADLLVHGVRCAACSWLIERAMGAVPGVRAIGVDPLTTRMQLRWDPAQASLGALLSRIAALGYEPLPYTEDETGRAAVQERRAALRRLIVAGLGMSEVMGYATALYAGGLDAMEPQIREFLRLVSMLVATPVVFYSAQPFFRGAWRGLRGRRPGMDVPVALAIAAAYAASVWNALRGSGEVYFDSAVMFVFFLSAARFLEMAGRHRALGLTGALARHLPKVATRLVDGRAETVGVVELQPGDLVLVQPGATVPADGTLAGDAARLDESLLTGESRPVRKAAGERVLAGSVNLFEAATVRVERAGADTLLAGIGRLVATAQGERPRLVQVTERVGAAFVVGVLALAALVGAAWWQIEPARAFEVVLAVLVVTCPCALALATPAAFTVGASALARQGVLVRRAGALEALSRADVLVFDKTGTLTEHVAGILRVQPLGASGAAEALALAAALESRSEHPLARAFPAPPPGARVDGVRAVPGAGLEGRVDGVALRIGTRAFALGPEAAQEADDPAAEHQSVWLAGPNGAIARFDIAEQVRPGAAEAIRGLDARGVSAVIASGDRPGPVRAAARLLGIAVWHASLEPAAKLALVRRMQAEGRVVGMVGDGINDSPVLAGADVSVAIGSGASLAQHAADCVLVGPGLGALAVAIAHARRVMQIVRQNLGWAVAYNVVAVPLAATGLLPPWVAALGMSASSLLVTFNALRLARVASPPPAGAPGPALRAEGAAP